MIHFSGFFRTSTWYSSLIQPVSSKFIYIFLISECGVPAVSRMRIIGGNVASEDKYPWQTLLQAQSGDSRGSYTSNCGGAMISPVWVITAAHCLEMCLRRSPLNPLPHRFRFTHPFIEHVCVPLGRSARRLSPSRRLTSSSARMTCPGVTRLTLGSESRRWLGSSTKAGTRDRAWSMILVLSKFLTSVEKVLSNKRQKQNKCLAKFSIKQLVNYIEIMYKMIQSTRRKHQETVFMINTTVDLVTAPIAIQENFGKLQVTRIPLVSRQVSTVHV